jgi:molybdate transport system regulatory protein
VAAHGSISAAARELGVTYRTAWRWIDRMNEVAGRPLVSTITGGQGGGGATLTSAGFAALEALDDLTVELERFTATMTARLMKRLG